MWGDQPMPFKEAARERVARRIKAVYHYGWLREAQARAKRKRDSAQPQEQGAVEIEGPTFTR